MIVCRVVSIISMSFVFVSIVGMVISTLPALQVTGRSDDIKTSLMIMTGDQHGGRDRGEPLAVPH